MGLLSDEEIEARLGELEGWTRKDRFIQRIFKFPRFMKAIEFINRVAELAEEADHHPDLENVWRSVTLKFTSHDAGGLTERDFNMAAKVNALDVEYAE